MIDKDTRLCMSLAGRPGNFGTRFHNFLYRELGLNYVYKAFTTADLPAAIGGVRALGIRGCAISMPFKEASIPLVDELAPSAAAIRSVNTIVNDDGRLTAYNTDYIAVAKLIESHGVPSSSRLALRGSGGMAKAVVASLRDLGFRDGTVVARNAEAGQALAAQYGFRWLAELPEEGAAMLVNVTPLGMEGAQADELSFTPAQIAACEVAFDVVAQPAETPFIKAALAAGKTVISGAEVIVLQAVEQFVLYTGVRPSADAVKVAATFAHGPRIGPRLNDLV
jgi:shikimate dehydrogenase